MTREPGRAASAGMHAVDGVLIVPAPADVDDDVFLALKKGVLAAVHAGSLRSVILDMSRIELLDSVVFGILADTARMAGLLGAKTVFVGFAPGVVSALVDMDLAYDDLVCASTLEDGLHMLRAAPADAAGPEEATGGEGGEAADSGEAMAEGRHDGAETAP